jgi:fatty-acyl-CoA synthase
VAAYTIASVIQKDATEFSARSAVALAFEDRRVGYWEIDERSDMLAAGLLAAGAAPGDRIAVLCRNSVESVEIFFAAAKLGAALVPIEASLQGFEIDYRLRDSGARWLFADWSGWDCARDLVGTDSGLRLVAVGDEMWTRGGKGLLPYEELVEGGAGRRLEVEVEADQTLLLRYGSGTTGVPRAVAQSHDFVLTNALRQVYDFGLAPGDVFMPASVAEWTADCDDLSLALWLVGGSVCLPPSTRFDADHHCAALAAAEATVTVASPSHLRVISHSGALGRHDLSPLRLVCAAGTPSAAELLQGLARQLPGREVVQSFGHPEQPGAIALLDSDEAEAGAGSVGRSTGLCELAVVDAEGAPVAAETVGEIVCRSRPGSREDGADPGAWLQTGDRGYLDREGFLFVLEGRSETIVSAGLRVHLADVEAALAGHHGVAEIALVPIASDLLGECSRAHVRARDGVALDRRELEEYARARLSPYKVPSEWVLHDSPLPRAACGRLERRSLVAAGPAAPPSPLG